MTECKVMIKAPMKKVKARFSDYEDMEFEKRGDFMIAFTWAEKKLTELNENPVKAFHYLIEPGEKTGMVEIGYIVEDSILNDFADLYYCIGQRGSEMRNSENRYIEVKK